MNADSVRTGVVTQEERPAGAGMMIGGVGKGNLRTLNICNIDAMGYKLLLPWLKGLQKCGADVHLACCCGTYGNALKAEGIVLHDVPMRRRWNPAAHVRAVMSSVHLLRSERFDIVIVHSAVGATVGRLACLLTGTRPVMYVVHGMFVTEDTPWLARVVFNTIEKVLSFVTDTFQFVSQEDLVAAQKSGLVRGWHRAVWGCGGVSAGIHYPDAEIRNRVRRRCGISESSIVVGIVARLVREKGFREFCHMARGIAEADSNVRFMVVGDSLPSDRDGVSAELRHWIKKQRLEDRFVLTGHTDSVGDYLKAMDIFVLPTYREGFPRSVLEAMATGLPVVATNIRGCREAVIHGDTGLLVPVRDIRALTDAVLSLINDGERRRSMGTRGRQRVIANFEEKVMTKRFINHALATTNAEHSRKRKNIWESM